MSTESMRLTDPHDHPEPHTMKWTQLEMDYINNRVETAVRQAIEQAQKQDGNGKIPPPEDWSEVSREEIIKRELEMTKRLAKAEQAQKQEPVTILPDGSAFGVMSWPLPKNHWLYAEREYRDGEYEPVELGNPILTHQLRDEVVSAVRYAIRGATNCGKDVDFDPDALVQNAVYALCGPYSQLSTTQPQEAAPRKPLTDEQLEQIHQQYGGNIKKIMRAVEAAHGIKEKNT